MSNDDLPPTRKQPPLARWHGSLFTLPPALRQLFDYFPLVTYSANELPARSPKDSEREENALYIFAPPPGEGNGDGSCNPACLKWQTYLNFHNIPFRTRTSNNHASPSGSLPFLLPAGGKEAVSGTNKLRKWIAAQKGKDQKQASVETEDKRYEVYASLIDDRIRKAWLFQLYLSPQNAALLHSLYITPTSSNFLVQRTILSHLTSSAEAELTKTSFTSTLVEQDIMQEADEAFRALEELLGGDEWFFGAEGPGWMDAGVFAYTHLLLDEGMEWGTNGLGEMLRGYGGLVRHERRVKEMYF